MEVDVLMVLYVLFGGVAAGSFWAAVVAEFRGVRRKICKRCYVAAFVSLVLAGVSIFMHLPHPENSIHIFSNLGSSWLSRETLSMGRKLVGFLGAVAGLANTVSTGMVYVVPAQPAWNTFLMPLMHVASAAVLGVFVFAAASASSDLSDQSFRKVCKVAAIALILQILIGASYLRHLYRVPEVPVEELLHGGLSPFFWMRVILGSLIPLIFIGVYLAKGERVISRKTLAVTCLLYVLASTFIETALIHWTSEPVSLFNPEEILGGV
ncbi:MAG: dimethyl sulfoxide reductase anchor subunit [Deltaproteobacteria bacterium]|nr:dimethyl sulfoxide reductase anchor subunit [Deltaproteobacteria bacterium]